MDYEFFARGLTGNITFSLIGGQYWLSVSVDGDAKVALHWQSPSGLVEVLPPAYGGGVASLREGTYRLIVSGSGTANVSVEHMADGEPTWPEAFLPVAEPVVNRGVAP